MAKQNRPGAQKAGSDDTQAEKQQQIQPASSASSTSKGKSGAKSRKPTIGGTAVQGAKSTQPKELSTATPVNRQPEYYNREMRRRMRQMGTGPYSERPVIDPRERRRKRQERLKERQERVRHIADVRGPSRDIKLGRRNTYFLIGIVALIALLIVVGLIINHVL
ncbi:MAG TPA: hypothetical protein VKV19_18060 [Ktedonobacteraceae bacterium]|nr:hypothetical protein [Ktedonobacteraceae bacterium]